MKLVALITCVVLGVTFFAYTYMTSYHCDHAECKLGEVMPSLAALQTIVEAKLVGSDGSMIDKINSWSGLSNLRVTSQGVISFSLDSDYMVKAVPILDSGSVTWSCKLEPDIGREIGLLNDCGRLFRIKP